MDTLVNQENEKYVDLTKDELDFKIEIATQTLERNISFIASCDNKTSIVLTSIGVLLTIILTNDGLNEIFDIINTCLSIKTYVLIDLTQQATISCNCPRYWTALMR